MKFLGNLVTFIISFIVLVLVMRDIAHEGRETSNQSKKY
jgi:hypothetical protein